MVLPTPGGPSIKTTLGFSRSHLHSLWHSHFLCGLKTPVILTGSSVNFARSFFRRTIVSLVKILDSMNCNSSSHQGKGHNTVRLYSRLISPISFFGQSGKLNKTLGCWLNNNHISFNSKDITFHPSEIESAWQKSFPVLDILFASPCRVNMSLFIQKIEQQSCPWPKPHFPNFSLLYTLGHWRRAKKATAGKKCKELSPWKLQLQQPLFRASSWIDSLAQPTPFPYEIS